MAEGLVIYSPRKVPSPMGAVAGLRPSFLAERMSLVVNKPHSLAMRPRNFLIRNAKSARSLTET